MVKAFSVGSVKVVMPPVAGAAAGAEAPNRPPPVGVDAAVDVAAELVAGLHADSSAITDIAATTEDGAPGLKWIIGDSPQDGSPAAMLTRSSRRRID
jgi:hypothetical protein